MRPLACDRIILLLALACCLATASATADEVLIVNPNVVEASIDLDTLKDLYLGRQTTWSNGVHIDVVVTKSGPSHDALMQLLDKSTSQFLISWKKLVFTGKGTMPEQVDSDDAVVRYVAMSAGAVGMVDRSKVIAGVKILPVH